MTENRIDLDKQGKSNKNVFIKKIGMKQNLLGNSPDEYDQTKYGRRYMYLFQGSLRYFKERVRIVTDLGVEPPLINPSCVHLNTPQKHNLSLEAINSVQKCGHGELSKGRMNRKQGKTNKQTNKI